MSKIDTSSWKEFKLEELFTSENGDTDIQKTDITGTGVDVITAGATNNGILGKSDIPAKIFDGNSITVDMFGLCVYRPDEYKLVTHARVFSLQPKYAEMSSQNGLFLATLIGKLTSDFGYSNMCSWTKIKDFSIKLPVKETEEIDWDFMHKYIRAMEKVVIKDVVQWKDKELALTKNIVNSSGEQAAG